MHVPRIRVLCAAWIYGFRIVAQNLKIFKPFFLQIFFFFVFLADSHDAQLKITPQLNNALFLTPFPFEEFLLLSSNSSISSSVIFNLLFNLSVQCRHRRRRFFSRILIWAFRKALPLSAVNCGLRAHEECTLFNNV